MTSQKNEPIYTHIDKFMRFFNSRNIKGGTDGVSKLKRQKRNSIQYF